MCSEFTFITPFFQRHGVGFLDVILKTINDRSGKISEAGIRKNQYEAMEELQKDGSLKHIREVIYLLPNDYKTHKGASSLWKEFKSPEKLTLVKRSILKLSQNAQESLEDLDKLIKYFDGNKTKEFPTYHWLEKNWRNLQDVWHIINEFSLATQVEWYKNNALIFNKCKFISLDVSYTDLENEYKTTAALKSWLLDSKTKIPENTYINLWGTATSFQLAFHYLSWSSPRIKPVQFIKCKTLKNTTDKNRFTDLNIELVSKDLLAKLESEDNKPSKLSNKQQNTFHWLTKYKSFDDNFTIMLLGPRGTGKTKVVKEVYNDIISVNCAQFQSNPESARSELFGHTKGSFTGSIKDRPGAFQLANKKSLFLDEVHHLDKATQSMLLTALQTDNDGNFNVTPLGEDKSQQYKFQLIVASNVDTDELDNFLLPDLLDRISQRILKIDPIKPGESIINIFNNVWDEMDFKGAYNPLITNDITHIDMQFKNWLTDKSRVFSGNYRDLQKIAILCADYQRSINDPDLLLKGTSLVSYVEKNWRRPAKKKEISIENFLDEYGKPSLQKITNEFRAKLVRSAELFYGDQKTAASMLEMSPKALIDIKKRDSP